ncbi:hypothetical protein DXA65_07125 [Ruminococcus sp. OF03-6AA]|nr:hypothetical protein DXA65_07125 [Ruminococcus sp. OF03-6AA]
MVGTGVSDGVGVAVGTGVAVAAGVAVISGILSNAASAASFRCSFSILFLWETNSIPPNPARINRMISRIRAVFSRFFLLLFFLICITSVYYNISEILCVFPVSVYFFSLIIPFL